MLKYVDFLHLNFRHGIFQDKQLILNYQVNKLKLIFPFVECCKKTGADYLKAWDVVQSRLPEQILITARSISEVLGFPMEENRKLNIPKHLRDRLQDAAFNDGITVEEKINQLLDMEDGTRTRRRS